MKTNVENQKNCLRKKFIAKILSYKQRIKVFNLCTFKKVNYVIRIV